MTEVMQTYPTMHFFVIKTCHVLNLPLTLLWRKVSAANVSTISFEIFQEQASERKLLNKTG